MWNNKEPLTAADNSIEIEIEQLKQFYELCGERMLTISIRTQRGTECKLDSRAVASQLSVDIRPTVLKLIKRLEEMKCMFCEKHKEEE